MVAIDSVTAVLALTRVQPSNLRTNAKSGPGAVSGVPRIRAASSLGFLPRVFDALMQIGKLNLQLDVIESGYNLIWSPDTAIAAVKSWVAAGLFKGAASGNQDDASLKQMASNGQLPDLPALTAEQQKQLSPRELNVYRDARYWNTYYEYEPDFGPPGISKNMARYLP